MNGQGRPARDLTREPEENLPGQGEGTEPAVTVRRPIDVRSVSLSLLAVAVVVVLLKYMQQVFIPFVLAGLLFYTLDPLVDRLERARMPRALAAALVLLTVLTVLGGMAYSLRDDAMAVVDGIPEAARKVRATLQETRSEAPGPLDRVQRAAEEVEQTAAETMGGPKPPQRGVLRVQVDEPAFRASDYLVAGSWTVVSLLGSSVMIVLLTYFLLVTDDLFKRKLVELSGPTLSKKKITVQLLDDIAGQIERFLLVQVFTSIVVGVATWLVLWWIGLDDAAFWGLLAGIFNSIPYFGPIIVTGVLSLVAFLQFETLSMTALVAAAALTITTLEGWLLTPVLMSRVAQMNQVAIFAGLLFWSWMWGVWGMLLAVPMMMVIKAVCDRVEDLQPIGKFLGE
jgi:predicted PurR-regulated permease PerM